MTFTTTHISDSLNELVIEEDGIQSTINQMLNDMIVDRDVPTELIKKYAIQVSGFSTRLQIIGADLDLLTDDEQEWMQAVSESHQEFIKALMPGENHAE